MSPVIEDLESYMCWYCGNRSEAKVKTLALLTQNLVHYVLQLFRYIFNIKNSFLEKCLNPFDAICNLKCPKTRPISPIKKQLIAKIETLYLDKCAKHFLLLLQCLAVMEKKKRKALAFLTRLGKFFQPFISPNKTTTKQTNLFLAKRPPPLFFTGCDL